MKIQKIRLKGFKSFLDETTIDFDSIQGLWWVSGQIGAGKTTIGEAIVFGLYGTVSGKTNKSLINWGVKHGLVELWCTSRGKNLYIKRELNTYGQSPMYVEADGEPIIFTDKRDAQSQLEHEYLDTPRTTMELLCIISFGNFKSLSTLNTKDTKIFLDQVLGFDVLTTYIDTCKSEQSDLRTKLLNINANINALNSQISRMKSYEYIEGDPEEIRANIRKLNEDITQLENTYREQLSPFNNQLREKTQRLAEVKVLGQAKRKEIDFIKKGTCPTCGAPIDQSQLELKEAERSNLIKQYSEIDAQIRDINAHISSLNEEMTKSITEQKNRVKSQENELIRLTEQMKHTKATEAEINRLIDEVETLTARALEVNTDLAEYDRLVQILQVQIRSQVLESFIPSLNSKIKELSGMLNLRYVPEYDSMFKCSIRSTTQENIPTSALSTGQLKMVDMVIILAIISTVISKVQSNVIFLDELFSNLDPRTRSELVAVLRATVPQTSSVLIVSHQEMDMGLFDGHLKTKLIPDDNGFDKTEISIIKS